ncbi:MAG: hypothetical protein Q9227_002487 [Pyrenula ochraceoflavens]
MTVQPNPLKCPGCARGNPCNFTQEWLLALELSLSPILEYHMAGKAPPSWSATLPFRPRPSAARSKAPQLFDPMTNDDPELDSVNPENPDTCDCGACRKSVTLPNNVEPIPERDRPSMSTLGRKAITPTSRAETTKGLNVSAKPPSSSLLPQEKEVPPLDANILQSLEPAIAESENRDMAPKTTLTVAEAQQRLAESMGDTWKGNSWSMAGLCFDAAKDTSGEKLQKKGTSRFFLNQMPIWELK